MKNYTVYLLKNSKKEIRYIGITKQKIKSRINSHKRDCFNKKRSDYNCPRNCWLRKTINEIGYIPYEVILSNIDEKTAFKVEKNLISFYGRKDLNQGSLMNADEGGTGGHRIKSSGELAFLERIKRPVKQYDFNGNLITSWDYILEAEKNTGVPNSKITSCCKGKRNSAGGFVWRYSEDSFNKFPVKNTTKRSVDVYSIEGEYLTTFRTSTSLGKAFKMSASNVVTACNGKQGTVGGCVVRWEGEPFNKYPFNAKKVFKKINEDIVRSLGKPKIIGN